MDAFNSSNWEVDTGVNNLFTSQTSLYKESQNLLNISYQKRDI